MNRDDMRNDQALPQSPESLVLDRANLTITNNDDSGEIGFMGIISCILELYHGFSAPVGSWLRRFYWYDHKVSKNKRCI